MTNFSQAQYGYTTSRCSQFGTIIYIRASSTDKMRYKLLLSPMTTSSNILLLHKLTHYRRSADRFI